MTPCHHYQMQRKLACYFFIIDFSFEMYVEIDRYQISTVLVKYCKFLKAKEATLALKHFAKLWQISLD